MTVPKKETLEQVFDRLYDNDNKIVTRKQMFHEYKQITKEWIQQHRETKTLKKRLLEELE